ncbi:MAG: hypothetical protein L0207_04025 [Chlamydiae bacterium]|nr:hypothetical protein [Chlamydiota bacterium]
MAGRIINTGGQKKPEKEGELNGFSEARPGIQEAIQQNEVSNSAQKAITQEDRKTFYTGLERSGLLHHQVERVRLLQEENDNLQREIALKEKEAADSIDPLSILADIEHRKTMIARNTGEILKIYSNNEARVKRVSELEQKNNELQREMMAVQGQFIAFNDMEERTKLASEFFVLKATIEKNFREIEDLLKN